MKRPVAPMPVQRSTEERDLDLLRTQEEDMEADRLHDEMASRHYDGECWWTR